MTATTPCLKPFMSTISTNWGEQPKTTFTDSVYSGSYGLRDLFGRSDNATFSFSQNTLQATETAEEKESQNAMDMPCKPIHGNEWNHQTLRGDSVRHTASVITESTLGDGVSTRSNNSQRMFIRKERTYSVHHG